MCKKCNYDRETDEIKTQILCNMKNKDLLKELWRRNKDYNTLEEIVDAIRASEAAEDHQNSMVGQTKEPTMVIKCYNCDKLGHKAASCPTKKAAEKPASQSLNFGCGFCGGKERCSYKNCRAYKLKCNQCNKFGHVAKCCNTTTRARARDNMADKIQWTKEDAEEGVNTLRLNQVKEKKAEKKQRQKEKNRKGSIRKRNRISEQGRCDYSSQNCNWGQA